jgi:hypothetical protein
MPQLVKRCALTGAQHYNWCQRFIALQCLVRAIKACFSLKMLASHLRRICRSLILSVCPPPSRFKVSIDVCTHILAMLLQVPHERSCHRSANGASLLVECFSESLCM